MRLRKWQVIMVVGILAGTLATLVQLVLWWATTVPLPATLYRDTRLTAAILLGQDVIAPEQLLQMPGLLMLFVASAIHFFLSLIYAAIYAALVERFPSRSFVFDCFCGTAFGLLIYVVNMYGFTFIFPWFAMVRDAYTIAAHIVFGLCLAIGLRIWRSR